MAHKVRFGLTLSNRGVLLGLTTPDELLEVAEMADAAPVFAHIWVDDQIMAKPRMESPYCPSPTRGEGASTAARTGAARLVGKAWPKGTGEYDARAEL
jgi:hypothetical protein